jgi:AbrB family looped-hinge helix DNA binding protein
MTHRIGAKGQVVIPKELRDRTGLHPGAEVEFALEGKQVVVRASRRRPSLSGRYPGTDMAAQLLEDRRREPR